LSGRPGRGAPPNLAPVAVKAVAAAAFEQTIDPAVAIAVVGCLSSHQEIPKRAARYAHKFIPVRKADVGMKSVCAGDNLLNDLFQIQIGLTIKGVMLK
jgi:hypothetical protein